MEAKDKIKQHITELGLSQSELARLSGLAFGTINRILNGKQELLPNTMAKIAEALNLSVSQLMDDDSQEIIETEVQGFKFRGIVEVLYNEGSDLCDVSFIKAGKVIKTIDGVFFDMLVETIDNYVENTSDYEERVKAEYSLTTLN